MGKVYESDVDAEEFIRSFREEPSGTASLKKKTPADTFPADECAPAAAEERKEPQTKTRQRNVSVREDEQDYLQRFVRNMSHMRPQSKYLMVEIDPGFIRKIKRILSFENGPACSVKAYVNNVLGEHFKEYGEIIKKRL